MLIQPWIDFIQWIVKGGVRCYKKIKNIKNIFYGAKQNKIKKGEKKWPSGRNIKNNMSRIRKRRKREKKMTKWSKVELGMPLDKVKKVKASLC